jgi:phospholipid/cholesterol/gamma-HCH transport system permease protein
METTSPSVRLDSQPDGAVVHLAGELTLAHAADLSAGLASLQASAGQAMRLCLKDVTALDTTGAWLIYRTLRDLRFAGARADIVNATPAQARIINAMSQHDAPCPVHAPQPNPLLRPLAEVGEATVRIVEEFGTFLAFLGLVTLRFFGLVTRPWRIKWHALVHQLEHVGFKALPIVGLMSFLIGLVLVQQGAVQLKRFGAEVFVVDLVSISTLRELGVILTAIMVAGRSGSAFTAQIGSMMLQEEVDALRTIGMDPIDVLVFPRMLALVLIMPILVFYASACAITGGAILSWLQLGIPIDTFISRFQETVTMNDFLVGMIKAPIFGLVIAVAGCFQGLRVAGGAQSVGERTTTSVVQSIFLVIVMDAFFAVFFTTIGM